jgi:hypothetical protein
MPAKSKSRSSNVGGGSMGGNGGIMGSGIFGMFGSSVQCKSDDNSYFCILSKIVNGLIMVLLLFAILYFIYYIVSGKFSAAQKGGGIMKVLGGGRYK